METERVAAAGAAAARGEELQCLKVGVRLLLLVTLVLER